MIDKMISHELILKAPWQTYANMLTALFKYDDGILIGDVTPAGKKSEADFNLDIEVYDHAKFLALWQLLPRDVVFGNVTMHLTMYDLENRPGRPLDYLKMFRTVFDGNPIVQDICVVKDPEGFDHNFICFRPEVIQFYNDDISDLNGNWSGLAQDIAKEVFQSFTSNIHFCTASIEENSDKKES